MTNNQLTKEWLQQTIAELESVRDEIPFGIDTNSELELAAFKLALTAMDSEPVAYAWVSRSGKKHLTRCEPEQWRDAVIVTPLYRHAQPAPVVTFYRDGIEAAAKWIDQQREAYDGEHGWSDPDTGTFEFGNDAQRGYSSTLEELAEGIRALHPNAGNSLVIPDASEDTKRLNWLDAQNKRLNEYYGTSYGWKFDANFQRNAMMLNDSNYPVMTVRQAIDEAIAAAPQEAKTERKK